MCTLLKSFPNRLLKKKKKELVNLAHVSPLQSWSESMKQIAAPLSYGLHCSRKALWKNNANSIHNDSWRLCREWFLLSGHVLNTNQLRFCSSTSRKTRTTCSPLSLAIENVFVQEKQRNIFFFFCKTFISIVAGLLKYPELNKNCSSVSKTLL